MALPLKVVLFMALASTVSYLAFKIMVITMSDQEKAHAQLFQEYPLRVWISFAIMALSVIVFIASCITYLIVM